MVDDRAATADDAHRQLDWSVRFDWGAAGAAAIAPGCDVAVVIDVLSFTTTLTVAVERGMTVFPYPWRDDRAEAFAVDHDATLAVGRSRGGDGRVSLSPASVMAAPSTPRLVLPSPNGSTISVGLAEAAPVVVGASLRNRRAVAAWLTARPGSRVGVVAGGERWPDGSLRPAVEDLWGAGALIAALAEHGWTGLSPEARTAAAAFRAVEDDVTTALHGCASGRELSAIGFADDVAVAAELDASQAVPVLRNGAFAAASP